MIPRGYEVADEFSQSGALISVPAGSTGTVITSRTSPTGSRIYLVELSARVVDAGSDQITLSLRVNGQFPFGAFFQIPGVQFDFTSKLGLGIDFSPGLFEIVATNDAAGAIRVQAFWAGFLLRDAQRRVFVY